MKRPGTYLIFYLLVVVVFTAFGQERRPLSLEDIEGLLRQGVSQEGMVRVIEERGINFDVTEDIKERLRKSGAGHGVIQSLERLALEHERKKLEAEKKRVEEERRGMEEAKRKEESSKDLVTSLTNPTAPSPPCIVGLRLDLQNEAGGYSSRTIARDGELCVYISTANNYYDENWTLVKIVNPDGGIYGPESPLIGKRLLAFPIWVGKSWEDVYSFPAGRMSYTIRYVVQSYEEIVVRAGRFKTFKIRSQRTRSNSTWVVVYLWYAPEVAAFVKGREAPDESTFRDGRWNFELVSASGPR